MRSYVAKYAHGDDPKFQLRQQLGNAARISLPKSSWRQHMPDTVERNSTIVNEASRIVDNDRNSGTLDHGQHFQATSRESEQENAVFNDPFDSEYAESTLTTEKPGVLEEELGVDDWAQVRVRDVNVGAHASTIANQRELLPDEYPQSHHEHSSEDDYGEEHAREDDILTNEMAIMNSLAENRISNRDHTAGFAHGNRSYPKTTSGHPAGHNRIRDIASEPVTTDESGQFTKERGGNSVAPLAKPQFHALLHEQYRERHLHELSQQNHQRPRKTHTDRPEVMERDNVPSAGPIVPSVSHFAKADNSYIIPQIENSNVSTSNSPDASCNNVQSAINLPSRYSSASFTNSPSLDSSLDYDVSTLVHMDFLALRDQPFDEIPGSEQRILSHGEKSATLSSQLGHVANLSHTEQELFFSSLLIHEWEQAGDWFHEQFSILVLRMKEIRQEQRAAAKSLETRVADRYEIVKKEENVFSQAMEKMKANGGLVLRESTPKRKRP